MAETQDDGHDRDARIARIAIAAVAALILLVVGLVVLFGPNAAYLAAAIATPLWMVGLIMLALESSNPEHARVILPDDEGEAA